VLVATDIAARGIDVSTVSHVINYDAPDTIDAYTHRVGRTGRATRTGQALTLITDEDWGFVKGSRTCSALPSQGASSKTPSNGTPRMPTDSTIGAARRSRARSSDRRTRR
jgi:ATP-dependent RNA helicase RhlE